MRRRNLSRHELDLWSFVARQVRPLRGKTAPPPPPPEKPPAADVPVPAPSIDTPPPRKVSPPPLAPIEKRLKQRVSRGQRPVDGVIDLHGMRQAEAHGALIAFIHRMHHQGATLVVVITGKGAGDLATFSEDERGVLRRLVPHWLADPSLRRQVMGFEAAPRQHGGAGALFVRLRKPRA
jgi:DNA-nicking Smr family endonuclease